MPANFWFGDGPKAFEKVDVPPGAVEALTDSMLPPGEDRIPVLKFTKKAETSPAARVTPSDLVLARAPGSGAGLSAATLAGIIHKQFPQLPVLGVAEAVLAGLPETSGTEMRAALTGYGIPGPDAQGAVNILYPASVTIQSTQPWQATGVSVTGTQVTSIACSGTWTANPATGNYGPAGDPRSRAQQGYALPGAAEGAMTGRVGGNPPFLVGSSAVVPAGQSGMLFLCINDDLDSRYGAGLADNSGSLLAVITTKAIA